MAGSCPARPARRSGISPTSRSRSPGARNPAAGAPANAERATAPGSRAASVTSNAATGGAAPASKAITGRRSGPDGQSSPRPRHPRHPNPLKHSPQPKLHRATIHKPDSAAPAISVQAIDPGQVASTTAVTGPRRAAAKQPKPEVRSIGVGSLYRSLAAAVTPDSSPGRCLPSPGRVHTWIVGAPSVPGKTGTGPGLAQWPAKSLQRQLERHLPAPAPSVRFLRGSSDANDVYSAVTC
jgi:hypothetical protein